MAVLERTRRRNDKVRVPSKPLLDWWEAHPDSLEGSWSRVEMASARRRLNALRDEEEVQFATAERLCCMLDVHASEIWGDLYWELDL